MDPASLALLSTARGNTDNVGLGRGGKAEWTMADVGLGLSQIQQRYLDAFMYRVAGDDTCRPRLFRELTQAARTMAYRDGWPKTLKQKDKLAEFCSLLLTEERLKAHQRINEVRCAALGVCERTWYRSYNKPHAQLSAEFESWIGTAWKTIAGHLGKY